MMIIDDVLVNKLSSIIRYLKRVNDVYSQCEGNFKQDYTSQDSVILNIQRACEASIDIANYLNKKLQFGIPQSSRDAFQLLYQNSVLTESLNRKMKNMIGLRNVAVHDYQELNLAIVENVIKHHLSDFELFIEEVKAFYKTL